MPKISKEKKLEVLQKVLKKAKVNFEKAMVEKDEQQAENLLKNLGKL